MAIDQGARNTHGAPVRNGSGGMILKKGPWTTAEDAILMEYVKRHGEGNWNAVQRNSGLMRCGKSCRLRWANHLRPNLKKGAFSPEEELQIIDLHAKLGNKWARMALHLHGRTDNEIKNYWNTRLKRRQRAGLPIYPPLEIQQNQNPNSSSSLHQSPNYYRSHPTVFNSFTFTSPNVYPSHDNSQLKLTHDNGCVALSLSSSSNQPFSTSSSMSPVPRPYYNQALPHTNFNMNALPTTMGASFNGFSFSQTELPSIQSPFEAITQTSSTNTSQSDYVIPASSEADNYEIAPELYSRGNSGLLGDVLGESQALLSSEKEKGKDIQGWEQMEDPDEVDVESIFKAAESNTTAENNLEDSSTGQSSLEIGPDLNAIDDFEEMNFLMTDDLSSLLDDFPLPDQPFPADCYVTANDDASTGISSDNNNVNNGNVGTTIDNPREVSCSPVAVMTAAPAVVAEAANHELNQGTCCWNNMPGFC